MLLFITITTIVCMWAFVSLETFLVAVGCVAFPVFALVETVVETVKRPQI